MRLNAHRLPPRFIHRLPPRFIHRLPPRLIHRLASYLLSWAYTQAASPSDTQAASYHRLPPIRGSLIHRLPPIPSDTQAASYTWLGPCCGALLRGPAAGPCCVHGWGPAAGPCCGALLRTWLGPCCGRCGTGAHTSIPLILQPKHLPVFYISQVRHPEYGARRLCGDAWEAGSTDNAAAVCCYLAW
jgi:hypothetical protein